jgi:hypothetical protein
MHTETQTGRERQLAAQKTFHQTQLRLVRESLLRGGDPPPKHT